MIEKIVKVEWDLKIETLIEDYYYQAAPICSFIIYFEDGKSVEFQAQIADKIVVTDKGPNDLSTELVNKIIDRLHNPLQKEVDMLMMKVEKVTKRGYFEKDFWDKFWVDNAMGK